MALEIRDEELVCVTDDDVGDVTSPVDHHPKLPVQRARHLRHAPTEFVGDPRLRRHAALIQRLKLSVLAWLQTLGVAVECRNVRLSGGCI